MCVAKGTDYASLTDSAERKSSTQSTDQRELTEGKSAPAASEVVFCELGEVKSALMEANKSEFY